MCLEISGPKEVPKAVLKLANPLPGRIMESDFFVSPILGTIWCADAPALGGMEKPGAAENIMTR
jgi:hypothetical protein